MKNAKRIEILRGEKTLVYERAQLFAELSEFYRARIWSNIGQKSTNFFIIYDVFCSKIFSKLHPFLIDLTYFNAKRCPLSISSITYPTTFGNIPPNFVNQQYGPIME